MQILRDKERIIAKILSYKAIILIGFFTLFSYIAFFLLKLDLNQSPWILGDWLINYQDGGFKRRGLSGSFLFFLQDITGISLVYIVYAVQLFFYLLFFLNFYRLLSNKLIPPEYFILIFTPVTLLFLFNDIYALGRKEIILLALFTLSALWHSEKNYTRFKFLFVLLSLFIFAFWHELFFFYVPYFIILHTSHTKSKLDSSKENLSQFIKICSLYGIAVLLPIILIFFFGTEINNGKSSEILYQRGISSIEGGIFTWNKSAIQYIKLRFKDYLLYAIPFFYGSILVFFYVKEYTQVNILYLIAFAIFFSFPLFIMAIDWGRWLFIHFTLILILLSSLLSPKDETQENSFLLNLGLTNKKSYYLMLFSILNLMFTMPHYNNGFILGFVDTLWLVEVLIATITKIYKSVF